MNPAEIAAILNEIAGLLELDGAEAERVSEFRAAAHELDAADDDQDPLDAISVEDGEVAQAVKDLATMSRSTLHTGLTARYPVTLLELTGITGIGPARAAAFYKELGITDLSSLLAAGKDGLTSVKGIGAATADKILAAAQEEEEVDEVDEEVDEEEEDENLAETEEPESDEEVDEEEEEEEEDEVDEVDEEVDEEEDENLAETEEPESDAEDTRDPRPATRDLVEDEEEDEEEEDEEEEISVKVVERRRVLDDDEEDEEKEEDEPQRQPEPVAPGYVVEEDVMPGLLERPDLAELIKCPVCQTVGFDLAVGFATCRGCSRTWPNDRGYIDLLGSRAAGSSSPAQRVMLSRFYAGIYEKIARPTFTRFLAGRDMETEMGLAIDLLDLQELGPDALVLDAGCGPGLFSRRFATALNNHFAEQPESEKRTTVVGLDVSHAMLKRASEHARDEGLDRIWFVRADALSVPFTSQTFDRIHCAAAFHLMKNHARVLREFRRVVKPNGSLVMSVFLTAKNPLTRLARAVAARFSGMQWFTRDEVHQLLEDAGFYVAAETRRKDEVSLRAVPLT